MFGVYFGKYLQDKGVLSKEQLNEILSNCKNTRVKMGLLAVESGYMTKEQADEVNMLQQMKDKRFGDIAVEKGYLTDDQVGDLLEKQGDAYLLFVQALIEGDFLTLEEIQNELNAFKKSGHYSAKDIEALKSGDVDRIVAIFTKDETIPKMICDYVELAARNIVRFVDSSFRMEKIESMADYTTRYISAQVLSGDSRLFTGFCGDGAGIKVIAESFAKEEFDIIDMDVLDSACEFLNCNNGLFATSACSQGVEIDMEPPIMKEETTTIQSEGKLYKVPIFVNGESVDLILSLDAALKLI